MKLSIIFAAALLALALPRSALAKCDMTDDLLKQAYPAAENRIEDWLVKGGDYDRTINPDAVVCKAWPYRPELTLAAVPLIEAAPANDRANRGDVEIIIADSASGKPIARRLEKGMAYSDGIEFAGVDIDTARYDIGPNLRAFGVRTSQKGMSRVDPYEEQALWLYTFVNGGIARILDGLIVVHSNGELDGDCASTFTDVERTVKMGPKTASGYRDLLTEQTVTDTTSKKVGGDCKNGKKSGASATFKFSFANGRYRPPTDAKTRAGIAKLGSELLTDNVDLQPAER